MRTNLLAVGILLALTGAGAAQESSPARARYYYGGEPHIGPATQGTVYGPDGSVAGRSYTHSDGATTIYGNDGRVMGRAAVDSQGTTTFYDAGGHVTGRAVPNGGPGRGR
jgi:hypothetical protein